MSSLYRRHRPQTWKTISGQNNIKLTLQQEIKDGRLVNAYLFSGPRGVGKTSIARILAKALNCTTREAHDSEPCNTCANCQEITSGRFLDVLEIDAASHTGVDHVREAIIENAQFAPGKGKYKIFIIDEVHMLSISAFNALLKIIEEPPAHVIFILATTELDKVPETIVSRCQRFDFKKIPHKEIISRLALVAEEEKISVDNEVYERIARQSEGCVRDAESLLGQLFSIGEKHITSDMADLVLPRFYSDKLKIFVDGLLKKDVNSNLNLIQTLASEGVDLLLFHEQLIEFIRFIMLAKFNPELARQSFHLNDAALASIEELAGRVTPEQLSIFFEETINAKKWWKTARISEIPLELLLLKITYSNSSGIPLEHQEARPPLQKIQEKKTSVEPSYAETPAPTPLSTTPSPILETAVNRIDAPAAPAIPGIISLDEIKKKWNDLLKQVQTYHHSLPVILRMSEPMDVVGNVLRIGLKYTFHRDKIKERKMSDLVEKALFDVLGSPLLIEPVMAVVAPTATQPLNEEKSIEFDDLVQTFGSAQAPSA